MLLFRGAIIRQTTVVQPSTQRIVPFSIRQDQAPNKTMMNRMLIDNGREGWGRF